MRHKVFKFWMLRDEGACIPQRLLFKEVFGYKVTVNRENMLKAHANGLDVFWFMRHFVGHDNWHEFSAYLDLKWYSHSSEIIYDFDKAMSDIIDRFIELYTKEV